jgi:hypothetical protein
MMLLRFRATVVALVTVLHLLTLRSSSAELLAPSRLYANVYHVTAVGGNNDGFADNQDGAFTAATNGIINHGTGDGQIDGFDTWQNDNTGVATDFVGLGYDFSATFDIVTVELGNQFVDGGDWESEPKVYILKNPALSSESIRPELSSSWVEVAAVPFNLPEEDEHAFDFLVTQGAGGTIHFALEGTPGERTGWGWAVGGVDGNERNDGLFNFVSVTELYAEGVEAPAPAITLPAAPQPINIVSNAYHSVNYDAQDLTDSRGEAFVTVTNGVADPDGPDGFDTWHGDAGGTFTDFVGLHYNSLVEFESITIDMGFQFVDGGDWEDTPKVYILKNPVDTNQTAPEDDPTNWVEVSATETTGHVFDPLVAFGEPGETLTFSLTGSAEERTGWGWAVGGVDGNQREDGLYNFISVTEVSAVGTVVSGGGGLLGDFDLSGVLDLPDIDDLTAQAAGGLNPSAYDLNSDALINEADVVVWVADLFNSWIGDANLDGEFNSGDLVAVLASGTYEADVDSVWSTGDFNADGRTNSSDLVAALAGGGYEQGPKAAVSAVPEPSAVVLLSIGLVLFARSRGRKAQG